MFCDIEYLHLNRIGMNLFVDTIVKVFLLYGGQKRFAVESQPFTNPVNHGLLNYGVCRACNFLGIREWTLSAMLLASFWSRILAVLTPSNFVATLIDTVTIKAFHDECLGTVGRNPACAVALDLRGGSSKNVQASPAASEASFSRPKVWADRPDPHLASTTAEGSTARDPKHRLVSEHRRPVEAGA